MKIFLISPVRNITPEQKAAIGKYVLGVEKLGHKVHWPLRDTNQKDSIGLKICRQNREAIKKADEVHIWWNETSQGSLLDFGMAFGLKKRTVLLENSFSSVTETPMKSINNVILHSSKRHRLH